LAASNASPISLLSAAAAFLTASVTLYCAFAATFFVFVAC